ncbi:MAG TPA: hypothetical protein VLJ84_10520 [Usitatibacter sp.]|nr:hypothetical protein [Usitatibacter sp.]
MNPTVLLSAALACTSALAFAPSYAQVSDDPQDDSATDSQPADSQPIDLDKIHGPVYVIQDPKTGTTYILVPKTEKDEPQQPANAYSPVRGVTYWA